MPERQKPTIRAKYVHLPVVHSSPIGFEVISNKELNLRLEKAKYNTLRTLNHRTLTYEKWQAKLKDAMPFEEFVQKTKPIGIALEFHKPTLLKRIKGWLAKLV